MTDPVDPLDQDGPAAPPRANGELVFTAPWQSRLFATTLSLHQQGRFEWDRFRAGLIAAISDHEADLERRGADLADYDYWGCWLQALEQLLGQLALVDAVELASSATAIANRHPDH